MGGHFNSICYHMTAQSQSSLIRSKLLEAGVRNLQEFGYPSCSVSNILTDRIYSAFYRGMLEDNLGKSSSRVDEAIKGLIAEIEANSTRE